MFEICSIEFFDEVWGFNGTAFEDVKIVEFYYEIFCVILDKLQRVCIKLFNISINFSLSWLIDLRRSLWYCLFQILLNPRAWNTFYIKNEFKKSFQCWLRVSNDVFVSNDVNRYFSIEPEFMKVLPYSDILLNELRPLSLKCLVVWVTDWSIMWTSAHHIEQWSHWV